MENHYLDFLREVKNRADKTQKAVDAITKTNRKSTDTSDTPKQTEYKRQDTDHYNEIFNALLSVSENLAKSYAQVKVDIQDDGRISWAGTAHEIREVIATLLRLLAPDEEVLKQPWYKQTLDTSRPTQKQRVRYILQAHEAGSKEREVVEQIVNLESMIGDLVRSTYSRASVAAHRYKAKNEVIRILRYFEAFAYDLLNLN